MNPIVHGVMAYEDACIAKLVKGKWDYMVHSLQKGYDFELQLWKFEVLRIPELRDAAVIASATPTSSQQSAIGFHVSAGGIRLWEDNCSPSRDRTLKRGAQL